MTEPSDLRAIELIDRLLARRALVDLQQLLLPPSAWGFLSDVLDAVWQALAQDEPSTFAAATVHLRAFTERPSDLGRTDLEACPYPDAMPPLIDALHVPDVTVAVIDTGFDVHDDRFQVVDWRSEGLVPAAAAGNVVDDDFWSDVSFGVPGNGGGAPTTPTKTRPELRRTPHLDVSDTTPAVPGNELSVSVYLDTSKARPGETSDDLVIADPPDLPSDLAIGVTLRTSDHFEIVGPSAATIALRTDEERSADADFRVRVKDHPNQDLPPYLDASFTYRNRPAGSVRRDVLIADPIRRPRLDPAQLVSSNVIDDGRPPDLLVEAVRRPGTLDTVYDVTVSTLLAGGRRSTGPWEIKGDTPSMVQRTLAKYFDEAVSLDDRRRELRSSGIDFFKESPLCFRELWWWLYDAGELPTSILITSDEPDFPWELMIPYDLRDGNVLEPLGVQCAIGRWLRGDNSPPRQLVPLTSSVVIVPTYPVDPLEHADAEATWVGNRFPEGERCAPVTVAGIDAWFGSRTADLVHYVGHGERDRGGAQALVLDGASQFLDPTQIFGTGMDRFCRANNPLVFLNACDVGGQTRGLVSARSFARSFIEVRAAAVLAPLWSVDDGIAYRFARLFYAAVRKSPTKPFAAIIQGLRAKAYGGTDDEGADTYAAYCWYGDPLASAATP